MLDYLSNLSDHLDGNKRPQIPSTPIQSSQAEAPHSARPRPLPNRVSPKNRVVPENNRYRPITSSFLRLAANVMPMVERVIDGQMGTGFGQFFHSCHQGSFTMVGSRVSTFTACNHCGRSLSNCPTRAEVRCCIQFQSVLLASAKGWGLSSHR